MISFVVACNIICDREPQAIYKEFISLKSFSELFEVYFPFIYEIFLMFIWEINVCAEERNNNVYAFLLAGASLWRK
jgi:hypothetical protein